MPETLFEETLRFRQPQLWLPLLILFTAVLGVQAYFLAKSPESLSFLRLLAPAICLVVFGGASLLLYLSRLDVMVTASGLHARFYPLERSFRDTSWKDIGDMRIVTVRPMRNFGGWGLRYGSKSKAYIVTGDQCVEFTLADGSRLYVNTLKPEEFLSSLMRGRDDALQKLP